MFWFQSVERALENLGGSSTLKRLYDEVRRVRIAAGDSTPVSLEEVVRKELEYNSSDSSNWRGDRDLFFSVHGIGKGVWGLRASIVASPVASDISDADEDTPTKVKEQFVYRIIRDTVMTRKVKALHSHKCQLCSSSITLPDGNAYAEAHHVIPIGSPHNGPDVPTNIVVVCPNHHAMLDLACIPLDPSKLRTIDGHTVAQASIDYHNTVIMGG